MKFLTVLFFVCTSLLLLYNCDSTDPKLEPELLLKLEDVSCTEAWLQLKTTNLQLPNNITLFINDLQERTFNLTTTDTLLYIDSLLPNQNYSFQIISFYNPEDGVKSNKVNATTMDTTSHNFTWQTWTLGEVGSSVLYDVAIIDENNIWAVGEIYMNDSLGQSIRYNAVHWNGVQWELERILYNGGFWIIRTICAFNENDIWFTGYVRYLNGQFIELTIPSILQGWGKNKIWGSSSNDLYIVGDGGNIAHYGGTSIGWKKIDSGTTTNINDIWGVIDQSNNQQIVYCAVSFIAQTGDQKILKIQNNKVDSLHWNTGRRVHSVWTYNNRYLYTAGGGIFENRRGYWNEITEVPLYYSRNIRGTDNNNIFVCGDFGLFAHFGGTSWKTYNELYIQGIYYSLSAKNNIVITVGFNGSKAIIMKGTRN